MRKKLQVDISIKNATAKTIIPAMEALKISPGWSFISEVLTENIEVMKNEILYGTGKWSADELNVYRRGLIYMERLTKLPDEIIQKYSQETPSKQNIELDPYKDA